LKAPERIDYGTILTLFEYLVPDPADRRMILWETRPASSDSADQPPRIGLAESSWRCAASPLRTATPVPRNPPGRC